MARDYRTVFTSAAWESREHLVEQLNRFANEGWRVECHKIDSSASHGWTIYQKTVMVSQPLLERSIGVGVLYGILNRVLEPGSEKALEFDAAIKDAVRQEGDR